MYFLLVAFFFGEVVVVMMVVVGFGDACLFGCHFDGSVGEGDGQYGWLCC